ncbi:hypothetical protein K437DRAFT_259300 [Tilletiaria anomala UBC 951]|uniref:Uncharacterized protein n=1 Tax=Tilletiaria anomala (strain ATCC 24038 / CBS 436.72 / UBC 951) TaxID=1037660 RepID=A0A066VEF9_TILAU|nr:uncharacterized protein K437DRAFT_259300 [Tilletiaria anomala UBC 951]KDN38693.1 hypothetical protein K437DRAFT_259300 [Tilletiaria anomala UBC 951]
MAMINTHQFQVLSCLGQSSASFNGQLDQSITGISRFALNGLPIFARSTPSQHLLKGISVHRSTVGGHLADKVYQ